MISFFIFFKNLSRINWVDNTFEKVFWIFFKIKISIFYIFCGNSTLDIFVK